MQKNILGDNYVQNFARREDIGENTRAMFQQYNENPEYTMFGLDSPEEALQLIHDDPSHFIFGDTMLARHHFSLMDDSDLDMYIYKNGFKLTSHIPVGKGSPFHRILNAGTLMQTTIIIMLNALAFP